MREVEERQAGRGGTPALEAATLGTLTFVLGYLLVEPLRDLALRVVAGEIAAISPLVSLAQWYYEGQGRAYVLILTASVLVSTLALAVGSLRIARGRHR